MDSFMTACGASQNLSLEIRNGPTPVVTLPHAFALVGRAGVCDLRLNHPQVSPRHAYFQLVHGHLACFDLGARGGLHWNDGRPARSGWLDAGRTVGIGPYMIRRVDSGTPERMDGMATPLNFDWDGPGPDTFLEFPDESGGPVRWHVRRAVTLVGRAPSCRVRLPDISVSWFHCSLVRTTEGLWVIDLLSQGGLTVNGIGQRCTRLEDGDELFIGRFRMVPRYEYPAQRSLPRAATRALSAPARASSEPPHHAAPANRPTHQLASVVETSAPLAAVEIPLEPEIVELLAANRAETPSPALIMLVERFGQMQQQMLEQFHQTMMMMVQQMGEQHREEMRQVREEVDRLRGLSEELLTLKGYLDQPRAAALNLPPLYPAAPGESAALLPPTAVPEQADEPRTDLNGHDTTADQNTSAAAAAAEAASWNSQPGTEPADPEPAATTTRFAPPPNPTTGEDPLVMVTRRIAQIRSEQRSRWQRILDLVRVR